MKNICKILLVSSILFGVQSLSAGNDAVMEMTDKNYKKILASEKPVFIKFWASWCRPCRKMTPEYKKASASFVGKVVFAELNTDKHRDIALQHKVKSIPTTILFKNGKELDRLSASLNQQQLEYWARQALKKSYSRN